MYNVKITLIMSFRGNIVKNANMNLREIVNFRKFAKKYTHKNMYIQSIYIHSIAGRDPVSE